MYIIYISRARPHARAPHPHRLHRELSARCSARVHRMSVRELPAARPRRRLHHWCASGRTGCECSPAGRGALRPAARAPHAACHSCSTRRSSWSSSVRKMRPAGESSQSRRRCGSGEPHGAWLQRLPSCDVARWRCSSQGRPTRGPGGGLLTVSAVGLAGERRKREWS